MLSVSESESEVAQLCLTLCAPMDCNPQGSSVHRILEWVTVSFSGGIFPNQGLNLGLPHCRQTFYCLSHQMMIAAMKLKDAYSLEGKLLPA